MSRANPMALRVAENVRRFREAFGWSKATLARKAKVPRCLVTRIEQGASEPTLTSLARVRGAFGVTWAALLDGPAGGARR
jgi:transcriptional regulator with XRE-family HTH domain